MVKKTESKTQEQSIEIEEDVPTPVTPEEDESEGGFMVSVRDIFKKNEERRIKIEQEKADRLANPAGSLNRLKVMPDTMYGIKFLHQYQRAVELYIHLWNGDEPCHEICKVHYGIPCDLCQSISSKFGECYAIATRCFIGWVYNSAGQTFTKRNERTGEVKTYNLNPVKLIEIPIGKDDANLTAMQEAARRGYFTDEIWHVERKKGKGFLPPKTVDAAVFQKNVGRDVNLEIPENVLKIGELSKLELTKFIIASFDKPDWVRLKMTPPTSKVQFQANPPTETSAPQQSTTTVDDLLS